jgi:hypothetical protein
MLKPRLDEGTEHVIHQGLVALAVGPEPLQNIVVNADIDMVFGRRDTDDGLRPVGVTPKVIYVGADRRLQLGVSSPRAILALICSAV